MNHYDVIVVGLGAMGSASLYHLAKGGAKVLGIDRFTPPHNQGSSHGQTRIIREAYFEDPLYVPLVQYAYEQWHELQQQTETKIYLQTGGLMIGPPQGVLVAGSKKSAELHKLTYEELSAKEITKRFPHLHPRDDMIAIWEPRAGVLFPEDCIATYLQLAQQHNAVMNCDEEVISWEASGDGVEVTTSQGQYHAAQILLSSGAWIGDLVPDLQKNITIERQFFLWFANKTPQFTPQNCPVHIWEYDDTKFFYSFPDLGKNIKVALHHEGIMTNAQDINREVSPDEITKVRTLLQKYVPELDGEPTKSCVCMYTNMPDGHFLIDRHPKFPQALIASPCSGHGFKFASALGKILATMLLEQQDSEVEVDGRKFDLSLFSWKRLQA